MEEVLVPAFLGALGGAAYAGSAFLKKKAKEKKTKWEWSRFLGTCFAGAVVGSYAFVNDGVTDPVKLAAYSGLITVVFENLWKAIKFIRGKTK